jgi:para-aminobenzoate synthetase/4-amino-4-deoxychorismate lyase
MSVKRPDPAAGVFETLLLRGSRVHALEGHLDRLERSATELYEVSLPSRSKTRVVDALVDRARLLPGEQRARIDVVPSDGRLKLSLAITEVPARRPVTLKPIVVPGGLGAHKWRDRRLIEGNGRHPVQLIVDADGSMLEAAWANVWMLDGDELITPPLDGRILPGVTRARLIELAPSLGLTVREEPIQLTDARAAGTLFLTSSLRLAVPAAFSARPRDDNRVDEIRAALLSAAC